VFHHRMALLCCPAGGITRHWVGRIAAVSNYFVDLYLVVLLFLESFSCFFLVYAFYLFSHY